MVGPACMKFDLSPLVTPPNAIEITSPRPTIVFAVALGDRNGFVHVCR